MELETVNIIVSILANGLRIYAIKRFVEMFFHKQEYRWKIQKLLYVFFWVETSFVYNMYHLPLYNMLANVAALILVIYPYKASKSRKFLVIFLIYVVNVLIDSFVVVGFTKYAFGSEVNQIYECITSLLLLLLVIIFERTLLEEKEIFLPLIYEIVLGLVPVVSIGIIYYVIKSAYEMKEMIISVVMGLFFINILIFYLYHSLAEFYSACLEKKTLEQMVKAYEYQLELVQESQNRVKALRHDLKHHIIELKSMAKEDEDNKMQTYLQDMEKFMLNPQEYVATGNQNVDGVLNFFLQKAHGVLKKVEVQINIPEQQLLSNFAVCAILGNLIENAIRAASDTDEKYLGVNIRNKQGILFVFIENSYQGEVMEKNDKFLTSQENATIHGIGLENVRKIVQMSGGEMEISHDQKRFEVEVLLYLSEMK
ncbi:MAG: GHKL domain-containing protein [Lachnospiraceae bacterium]|nr:GHKL domain-containing protein [Lachnospiraceae bacterium]